METEVADIRHRALLEHRINRIFFVVALAALTLPIALDVRAENLTLEGSVSHVRDGDTIELGPIAVRLQGIAAPERDEAGGAAAADAMRDLVLGRDLRCDLTGDTHGSGRRPMDGHQYPLVPSGRDEEAGSVVDSIGQTALRRHKYCTEVR